MKNEDRIVELLVQMVQKQDEMVHELKVLQKRTDKNTAAIGELRLSNMRLIDLLEGEINARIVRLENAVFKS